MEPVAVARSYPNPLSGASPTNAPLLPVDPVLADLLPEQGFRRGSVIGTAGPAGWSLLLGVLGGLLGAGSWAAVVGLPELGVEAAVGFGVRLDRLVLVPEPGPRWAEVVSALLDAVEVVVLAPPGRCRASDARRLAVRTRDRHGLLVVVERPRFGRRRADRSWPESVDLLLEAAVPSWRGCDGADGVLRDREVTVTVSGRRSAGRERTARVRLPSGDGSLAASVNDQVVMAVPAGRPPEGRRVG